MHISQLVAMKVMIDITPKIDAIQRICKFKMICDDDVVNEMPCCGYLYCISRSCIMTCLSLKSAVLIHLSKKINFDVQTFLLADYRVFVDDDEEAIE